MRAVLQRVKNASVTVGEEVVSSIDTGFVILLGVAAKDGDEEIEWLLRKIVGLRIFEDADEKMNLSIEDVKGKVIVVSQFTLYADCSRGNRPSFTDAAPAEQARAIYERFVERMRVRLGVDRVGTGIFQADMQVRLQNDGPVTIILER